MEQKSLVLDQIEVEVLGFFTTHHHFRTETGTIGELTMSAFSQVSTFRTVDGRELEMKKPRWLGSEHELLEGTSVRGRARQRALFSRDYVVEFDGHEYDLVPEGVFKQGWFLTDSAGTTLLEFQPRGAFKQGVFLTVWGAVDADLAAFAYYLVYQRQQEAAAGAVTATS